MPSLPEPRLERILVSVDFGESSLDAARWTAAWFAPKAEIIFAHVIEPPPATRASVIRYPSIETIVSRAHEEDEARLKELCASLAPGRSRAEIRVGTPHEELALLAETVGADVLVVGRQDLASSGWARIGTTAQRILRTSRIPILMVTGESQHAPGNLLVAVDESEMTDDVLSWGSALAARFHTKATVIHASGAETPDDASWLTDELAAMAGGESMETVVTRTPVRPAESIVAEARARSAHLLVIGSRGAGSADQRLFGSVAESVLLSSPCPVLVVVPVSRPE